VGLLHAAGEVDAACIAVVDTADEVDAATPWALGIPVDDASSEGLTGDVALHAAGLADAPCVHADARVARKRWRGGSRGRGWERGRGGRLAACDRRRRVRQVEVGRGGGRA
jgi:hypothetical protein